MRTIDLDDYPTIELWPGRRLFCLNGDDPAALYSLPRSVMTLTAGERRSQLCFGSPTKTSVIVAGPKQRIAALAGALITAERPDGAVVI